MMDVRVALRVLLRNPGFTAAAVLTLALGIGANTAIFSSIQAILLRPLPYAEADRVVMISEQKNDKEFLVANANYLDWQRDSKTIEHLGFWPEWRGSRSFILPGKDGGELLSGTVTSSTFFHALAAHPLLGRLPGVEEDKENGALSVMLSHRLWQRRFSGDPNIIGQSITLDNFWRKNYTIIGVLPPGFHFPENSDLWISRTALEGIGGNRTAHRLKVVARLKPGVTLAQAQAELSSIQYRLTADNPHPEACDRVRLTPLLDYEVGRQTRPALLVLFAAVACLLLISCANVANLLLARGAAREQEMAIRIALGAGRKRILTQLLTEGALLSFLGAIGGLLLASWSLRILVLIGAQHIPRLADVTLNPLALAFTLTLSALAAILFAFAPAAQFLKASINHSLKEAHTQSRFRDTLVVCEIALTLLLLIGAGLTIKSLARLQNVPLGFNPDHLITAEFDLSATNFYSNSRDRLFFRQLMDRVSVRPGVQSVSGAWYLPVMGRAQANEGMTIEPRDNRDPVKATAAWNAITENYFQTVSAPILQGRAYTPADAPNAHHVVIINESFARQYFPNKNPIGQRLAMGLPGQYRELDRKPHWREIIGVVADIRPRLDIEPFPEAFYNYHDWPWHVAFLVVRAAGDPSQLTTAIREDVRALNPDQPISSIRTFDQIIGQSTAQQRFRTLLLTIFSATALILCAIGLYGVISYLVSQRTREFGIRMALGARNGDLLQLVLKRGMLLVALGSIAGLAAALALTRVIQRLLYQVDPSDTFTLLLSPLFLALIALIACYIPARRASRVNPLVALRCE